MATFKKNRKRCNRIDGFIERRDRNWRKRVRRYLRKRYGERCHWCGGRMDFKLAKGNFQDMATIEHLVPMSFGGSNDLSNLRLAHKRCNR